MKFHKLVLFVLLIASAGAVAQTTSRRARSAAPKRETPFITYKTATPAPKYPETAILQPVDAGRGAGKVAPVAGKLQAVQLTGPYEAIAGTSSQAGDFLLQNELISVIVNAPEHTTGNALTGGYIIDAVLNATPLDQLGQLHLYHNDRYPRMARFTTARIVEGKPGSVSVEVTGVDSQTTSIDVISTYTLRAKSNALEIRTALIPRGEPLKNFTMGDAFAWGQAQQFIPGKGFKVSGRFKAPWVGAAARGVAYGYYTRENELWGPTGSNWVDPNGTTITAALNTPGEYVRYFVVARDLAEVTRIALAEKGIELTTINGNVRETDSDTRADGVRILASNTSGPVTQAISRQGQYSISLPAGEYEFSASDLVRSTVTPPAQLSLPGDATTTPLFLVDAPAVLNLICTDADEGNPIPFKVTFVGTKGTSDPDLGPQYERHAQNTVHVHSGRERLAIPAGDYDAIFSRGIEYDITTHSITLRQGRETTVEAQLKRAVQMKDWISADFHQHMQNSFDSAIPLEDRVISSLCEGLQLVVATDHNFITDLGPVIERLRVGKLIRSVIGVEATTRKFFFGHFNAFPIVPDAGKPNNGAIAYESTYAKKMFEEAAAFPGDQVIQVNHPRSSDIGYFNQVHMSPDDGSTTHPNWSDKFTAIEIFNGKRTDELQETLTDWFNLLNMGYTFTAVGNSDSHKIYDQEPGYPRNYVHLPGATPASLQNEPFIHAINHRHALFSTNGPMLSFSTKRGTMIGATEKGTTGQLEFNIEVRGANYVQPDSAEVFANGKSLKKIEIPETSESLKLKTTVTDNPSTDTWYVLVVRGKRTLYPVISNFMEADVPAPPVPAAFTNPIWIDRDGDGIFSASNEQLKPAMQEDRSEQVITNIDRLTSESQVRNQFRRRGRRATTGGET